MRGEGPLIGGGKDGIDGDDAALVGGGGSAIEPRKTPDRYPE